MYPTPFKDCYMYTTVQEAFLSCGVIFSLVSATAYLPLVKA